MDLLLSNYYNYLCLLQHFLHRLNLLKQQHHNLIVSSQTIQKCLLQEKKSVQNSISADFSIFFKR